MLERWAWSKLRALLLPRAKFIPTLEPHYPPTLPQNHIGVPSPEPSMLHPTVYPSIGPFYLATNTPTYNPSYTEPTFNPSPLPTLESSDPPTLPPIPAGVPSPDPSSLYPTLKIRPSVLDPSASTYNPFFAGPTFNKSPFPTLESTDIPTLHSNHADVSSPKTSSLQSYIICDHRVFRFHHNKSKLQPSSFLKADVQCSNRFIINFKTHTTYHCISTI